MSSAPKPVWMSRWMPFWMPFWMPLAIAFAGGCLMGITPAPVNAWPLAWIAIVPLWVMLFRQAAIAPSKPVMSDYSRLGKTLYAAMRSPLMLGFLWGLGYHGLAAQWITGIHPMDWMGVPWLASIAIALFCWSFLAVWGAVLVTCWAWGMVRLEGWLGKPSSPSSSLLRVLVGTALWCVLEWIWSNGPLWWTSISYTQSPYNLIILHLGRLSGPAAVTAAIVAVNGLLAEAILGQSRRMAAIALTLLLTTHAIGFSLYSQPLADAANQQLKVGIIQGNIPNTIKLYEEGWRRAIEGYTAGYRLLARQGVDAVLTPETALPTLWTPENRRYTSFYQAVVEEGVVAWLGAFGKEGRNFTNSLFTIAPDGETLNEYRKVKLVPLGEYIPFAEILGGLINRLSPLDAVLVPGHPNQRVDTPWGRAIAGICYESAFSKHFRQQAADGGEFIITASNNAHYSEAMPAQHHAQDVMRAVETDRWAARATNTGYSGVVDPHGRTLWISGINTYEAHADRIYRRQTRSLYVRWGDWLTPVLVIAGAIGFFAHRAAK